MNTMRMRVRLGALLALAAVLLLPLAAQAVELADFKVAEDRKRVTLSFRFEPHVKAEETYHYANNFVSLRAAGLKFGSDRLKADAAAPTPEAATTYRFVRFSHDADGGEIRIYLQKPLTPADAQIVPYDDHVEIVLLKPNRPSTPDGPLPADADPVKPPVSDPPPADMPPVVPPADAEPLPDATPADPPVADMPPAEPADSEPPAADPPALDPPAAEPTNTADQPADGEPAAPLGGRPYTEFNLNEVPVKQLEFRGVPFRETLLELVAGTGFNVVVDDGIENTEASLNFTQKQLSLQSALDLLAMAYDFTWSVEADAIVIKAK